MRRHDEMRLRTAVQTLQGDAPECGATGRCRQASSRPPRYRRDGRLGGRYHRELRRRAAFARFLSGRNSLRRAPAPDRGSPARLWRLPPPVPRWVRSGSTGLVYPCGKGCICLALASIRLSNSCLFRTSGLLLLRLQSLLADPAGSPSRSAIDRWLRVWHFRCRRSPTVRRRPAKGRRTVPDQWRRACRSSALRWIHG